MSLDAGTDSCPPAVLEPLDELLELTRALRVHAESLLQAGAFGVPRSEVQATARQVDPAPGPPRAQTAAAPHVDPSRQAAAAPPTKPPLDAAAAAPVMHPPRVAAPLQSATPPRVAAPVPSANMPRVATPMLSFEERRRQLAVLAESIVGCTQCRLHEQRTQTVFARGSGQSGLCFVGEGPGADEDAQGFPFVGAAGQLLDRMIAAMGFGRDEVYVCNIVKCRPPDNRKPLPEEMRTCMPYLREQLEILAPEVIVALGATAVEGLLGIGGGITRLRGTWRLYQGRIAVMPTFHPAYLLRAPSAKHVVWEDMQAVLRHMGRPIPARGKSS